MINTMKIDPISGLKRERFFAVVDTLASAAVSKVLGVATRPGTLRNVKVHQLTAGAGATSHSTMVTKQATNGGGGTNMLATAAAITVAAGANKGTDSEGKIATGQTGVTQPVLSATAANLRVAAGDAICSTTTPTGTYSPSAVIGIEAEIEYDY